jgi:hypothetical protein
VSPSSFELTTVSPTSTIIFAEPPFLGVSATPSSPPLVVASFELSARDDISVGTSPSAFPSVSFVDEAAAASSRAKLSPRASSASR